MRTLPATTASGSALPFWLPSTRTFSGTPTSTNVGTISVRGTANDLGSVAASETLNIGFDDAERRADGGAGTGDATEKCGALNGSGGAPATGNVLTNDTDPDAGDTKTVTFRQLQRHGRHPRDGTHRRQWQCRAQCVGHLHLYGQRGRCSGAGAAPVDPTRSPTSSATRCDAAGATASATLTVTL